MLLVFGEPSCRYRKLELDWSIVTKNERILLELDRLLKIDVTDMSKPDKESYITELAGAGLFFAAFFAVDSAFLSSPPRCFFFFFWL
jgi:hypothetical protein